MHWSSFWSLFPFLASTSVYGLVEQKIDEKAPLSLALSTTSHNRISVQNGAVAKIIGPEAYFSINIDSTTGNAFITVLKEIPEPLTLTVVTSSGLLQDLAITAGDRSSEYLILREVLDDTANELSTITSPFHLHTVEFLNKILEGKVPLGYGERAVGEGDILSLPSPLMVSTLKAFEGPYEEIFVYSLQNTGKDLIIISSDVLKKGNAAWVFLNAHELKSKEQALCIISYPKSEN